MFCGSMILADYITDGSWFPEQASTFAEMNDWLYWVITIICVIFFVPIAACLFGFAIKYRKPKGEKAESNIAHHTPIELLWSIGPSFFLVFIFYLGARGYLDIRTVPEGAYEVGVTARTWSWSMNYGRGTQNPELHLLVNEPTKLTMRSEDVIHSLYIPAFRAKKDIVPGRYNYMWFQPTVANEKVSDEELAAAKEEMKGKVGWDYEKYQFTPQGYRFYDLYCTEYCGKDHSMMQSVVVVHETQEDLDAWIEEVSARGEGTSKVEWGGSLYQNRGCKSCHSLDGVRLTGPSYKGAFGTTRKLANGESVLFDANYVRESIINPKAKIAESYAPVMPSYRGQFSDDDIDCLVEFIKSQSPSASGSAGEQAKAGTED